MAADFMAGNINFRTVGTSLLWEEDFMKLEPFGERIIVKRKITERVGLIHIPEDKQKRSLQGEVIEAGPETHWVKVGDKVLFWKHSGFELPSELGDQYKDSLRSEEHTSELQSQSN